MKKLITLTVVVGLVLCLGVNQAFARVAMPPQAYAIDPDEPIVYHSDNLYEFLDLIQATSDKYGFSWVGEQYAQPWEFRFEYMSELQDAYMDVGPTYTMWGPGILSQGSITLNDSFDGEVQVSGFITSMYLRANGNLEVLFDDGGNYSPRGFWIYVGAHTPEIEVYDVDDNLIKVIDLDQSVGPNRFFVGIISANRVIGKIVLIDHLPDHDEYGAYANTMKVYKTHN